MNSRITELLEEIREREEELEEALRTQQVDFFYRLEGTRVRFERRINEANRRLRVGIFRWLAESKPRNIASAPVIYSMIVPFVFLDLMISIYQLVCFPLYRIAKVRRRKYIAIDRHSLSYLNGIEKLNCIYCGYVNGLIAYAREIVARTEQYWCPIKHARKILDPHRRYARFADFGDSGDYHAHLAKMRAILAEQHSASRPDTE